MSGSAYNFLALVNLGATVPAGDGTQYRAGTSFSTPLVSGVVALMLAVAPNLTPDDVRDAPESEREAVSGRVHLQRPRSAAPACWTRRARSGCALASTGAAVPVTIVEYYHAALDHYFMTWSAAEIALLDAGTTIKGWTRTGRTWQALMNEAAGTSPVCRIYIPPGKGDGHYFGRDAAECNGTMAKNPTFVLETPAFFYLYPPTSGNCAAGTVPVYRVYSNRADANHRYTTDRAVRDAMVAKGGWRRATGPTPS